MVLKWLRCVAFVGWDVAEAYPLLYIKFPYLIFCIFYICCIFYIFCILYTFIYLHPFLGTHDDLATIRNTHYRVMVFHVADVLLGFPCNLTIHEDSHIIKKWGSVSSVFRMPTALILHECYQSCFSAVKEHTNRCNGYSF